jgi:hypothetical protein
VVAGVELGDPLDGVVVLPVQVEELLLDVDSVPPQTDDLLVLHRHDVPPHLDLLDIVFGTAPEIEHFLAKVLVRRLQLVDLLLESPLLVAEDGVCLPQVLELSCKLAILVLRHSLAGVLAFPVVVGWL